MQTLTAEGLKKSYGDKILFQDLNLLINAGERIGLIGVNGSGKTTLLRGLAGIEPFDAGEVSTPKNYRIGYLAQQPELNPDLAVLDAIYAGETPEFAAIREYEAALEVYTAAPDDQTALNRYTRADARMTQLDAWQAETEIKTILSQLKIADLNGRVGHLSGGQQKRVALAQALIAAPDLLILDEPTNHLDFDTIAWLEKTLAAYKGALLLVTHDRYFLDRITNHIWELDRGVLRVFEGNYDTYVAEKAKLDEAADAASHKRAQLYKQELAWMRAGAQARSTKQQARINRFNELSQDIKSTPGQQGSLMINIGAPRLGKQVIELQAANLAFDEKTILRDFSWLVQAGDRIGITGENGAGKSSLLNVIAGKLVLDSGEFILGSTVRLGYYDQTSVDLPDDKRVISYLEEIASSVPTESGERVSVTEMLEQFLFPRSTHGTLIGRLSGGEKRRLYLLRVLMMQPNVLLLDEPTNDLDIATLTVLEAYLQQFPGTVITVSHDRYFLDKVADKLLIFDGDGVIDRAVGELSAYLEKDVSKIADSDSDVVQDKGQELVESTPKVKTKLTYAEQMEYDGLTDRMDALDAQIEALKAEMATVPGTDYNRLGELQGQIDQLDHELDTALERYTELDEYVS